MIIDSVPPSPRISSFHPSQQRADAPSILRWNPCTAKFLAICLQQPPVTSHAACACYHLGGEAADWHRTLTRQLDHVQKHLIMLHTHILHLLHCCTFLQPATLVSVLHNVERTSNLCHSLSTAAPSHSVNTGPHCRVSVMWATG